MRKRRHKLIKPVIIVLSLLIAIHAILINYSEATNKAVPIGFNFVCKMTIPGETVLLMDNVENKLTVISRIGEPSKETKYAIRCINPENLEENWELIFLRFNYRLNDQYLVLSEKGKDTLYWFDIDNANEIKRICLKEEIINFEQIGKYSIVATPTNIYVFDELQRQTKIFLNDSYFVGAGYNNLVVLGKFGQGIKCIDYLTGETKWKYDFNLNGEGITAVDSRIITASRENELISLNITNGNILWKNKLDKKDIDLTNYYKHFYADKMFVNDNPQHNVYCININNGMILWINKDINCERNFHPSITNNRIYIKEDTRKSFVSLNAESGNAIARFKFGKTIDNNNFVLINNNFYILTRDDNKNENTITCFKFIVPVTLTYNLDKTFFMAPNVDYYMDVKPSIVNGSTYMPAKYLLEPLGGEVTWIQKDKKATCVLKNETKDITIEMQIGNPRATLNGKQVQIDPKNPKITPIIINGRTMVPLRFLAESLGCNVEWKPDTKEIIVTYQP